MLIGCMAFGMKMNLHNKQHLLCSSHVLVNFSYAGLKGFHLNSMNNDN